MITQWGTSGRSPAEPRQNGPAVGSAGEPVPAVLPWEKDSPHFLDSINFHTTNDLGKLLFEAKSFICFYWQCSWNVWRVLQWHRGWQGGKWFVLLLSMATGPKGRNSPKGICLRSWLHQWLPTADLPLISKLEGLTPDALERCMFTCLLALTAFLTQYTCIKFHQISFFSP